MDGKNTRNLFLSSLASPNRERLVRRSTAVPLPVRTVLFEAGECPDYAYFMTSGLASVVSDMKDGAAVEVGMHGREGVVSAFQVLGPKASPMRCFMQIGGTALRISMADLRAAFHSSEDIREKLLENLQKESMILGQIAACNRLHESEERLARWLLMVRDRTQSDVLNLTQEFLAEMLGSRRATVTLVAGTLQRSGLIEYHRGRVKIVDSDGLEEAACDCYRVVRDLRSDVYNGN
jgi:CRP-like cAMP-binding protein